MIAKPVEVKALNNFRIWLKYSDSTAGEINLSHLVGQGIFSAWKNSEFFNKVHIDSETKAISWDNNIELCPNSLYLKIKGITFEQWQKEISSHASNK